MAFCCLIALQYVVLGGMALMAYVERRKMGRSHLSALPHTFVEQRWPYGRGGKGASCARKTLLVEQAKPDYRTWIPEFMLMSDDWMLDKPGPQTLLGGGV